MSEIVTTETPDFTTKIPRDTSEVDLGQWFWVTTTDYRGEDSRWLGCVTKIGSNFCEVASPSSGNSYSSTRVHFDAFWDKMEFEPNAEAHIQSNIEHWRAQSSGLLEQIKTLTARLGVSPQTALADSRAHGGQNAIAVVTSQPDVKGYKAELELAKKETLPNLFKDMETANSELARWMSAPAMPLRAMIGPMKASIEKIDDAIFNISLYAGLTEDAVSCGWRNGEDETPAPAAFHEKLHIMQRRLYMDEESLLNYTAGGMKFDDIREFDDWIAKPENRDRILPFPRTMVAFRVRRYDRELEGGIGLLQAFINIQMRELDKVTVLYIRNGDQVWRIQTEMDYGAKLFPDADFDHAAEMMVEMFAGSVRGFMPKREYDVRKATHEEAVAKWRAEFAAWKEQNPGVHHMHAPSEPYTSLRYKDFEPYDPSSVYYDDASKVINKQIVAYNRVGLIVQGLFDRSPVLHPHAQVKTWTPEGFEQGLKLVYDGSGSALYDGEAPDFEAFRRKLNAQITDDSLLTGQDDYWSRSEAVKENKRINHTSRGRERHYTRYRPYGNPGPGLVSKPHAVRQRAGRAVFRWTVSTQSWRADNPTKAHVLEVPLTSLLNVSAYKPGDYKQFFADPRTRAEYIKWAPMMLAAEDYHVGVIHKPEINY